MSFFIQDVPADSDDVNTFSTKVRNEELGINEQTMNQLFEPFPRLGAEDTNVQGTGIGLTTTKNLAVLMDGGIFAEFFHGVGSTFSIILLTMSGE